MFTGPHHQRPVYTSSTCAGKNLSLQMFQMEWGKGGFSKIQFELSGGTGDEEKEGT